MNTAITDKSILLSKKGMKELKKSIIQLEHDKQNVMQSIKEIDKMSNHEDKLYRIEKLLMLESIDSELIDKKLLLSMAKIIPVKQTRLSVALGSMVELVDKYGHLFRYTIVESIEANPSDGRISTNSPLGKNLIGKKISETVIWGASDRPKQLQLIKIM